MPIGLTQAVALGRYQILAGFSGGVPQLASIENPATWTLEALPPGSPGLTVTGVRMTTGGVTVALDVAGGMPFPARMKLTTAAVDLFGVPASPNFVYFDLSSADVSASGERVAARFLDVEDSVDVPNVQLFDLFPLFLRELDRTHQHDLLRRLLVGSQETWERFWQDVRRLRYALDPYRAPGEMLEGMRTLLGFGLGSGAPDVIASRLSEADLRKLLTVAAAFWAYRGTPDSVAETLMAFTHSVRPIIDDWFYLRWVLASSGMIGESGPYHTYDPYAATDETPPNEVGGEMRANIYVPDFGDLDHEVAAAIVQLAKPVGELWWLVFCDFLDSFVDGLSGNWKSLGTTPVTLEQPAALGGRNAMALTGVGARVRAYAPFSLSWTKYTWESRLVVPAGTWMIGLRFYVQDNSNYYTIILDSVGGCRLFRYIAGVPVVLSSQVYVPVLDAIVRLDVAHEGAGNNQIRVYYDGNLVLEDSSDNTYRQGAVEYSTIVGVPAPFKWYVARTFLHQNPVDQTLLHGETPVQYVGGFPYSH